MKRVDLIGRETLLDEITVRVTQHARRLVSVVGPGGIGKTALARAAHGELAGDAAANLVVELIGVEDADAVRGAIAAQLGFPSFDVAVRSAELANCVVLIDNCEHVLDAAAAAIETLLTSCPTLVVVATSRSPLSLPGESIVALTPLDLPELGAADADCASLRMFRERARDNGVTIGDSDLEQAGEVCRRLDGVPLALELAAARLRTMNLPELCSRLGEGISLLNQSHRRGAARHRSVRDTIEWSVRLLNPADQVHFAQLSVCPGVFDVELAAAVADVAESPTIELIERLVEASLLVVEREGARRGYRLLQPIRAIAVEHLRSREALASTRERFAEHVYRYVLATLDEASRCWSAELIPTFMARFDQVAAALRHCLDNDADPARAQALGQVLLGAVQQGRVDDVAALIDAVLRRWTDKASELGPQVAAVHAMGRLLDGDIDAAEAIANAAMFDGTDAGIARSWLLRVVGLAARLRGGRQRAADLLEQAAVAADELGAITFALEARTYRAQDVAALGDIDAALQSLEDIAAESARRGSIINELVARTFHADLLSRVTPTAALHEAEATLRICDTIKHHFGIAANLQTVAACRIAIGDVTGAATAALRLLDVYARAGAGEFRRALDIATAVIRAAGHADTDDLAATAQHLPDTHPMETRFTRPPAANGVRLDRPAAAALARRELRAVIEHAQPLRSDVEPSRTRNGVFRRVGDMWEVDFDGTAAHVVHSKGMEDLASMLARPDRDIHCVELAGASVEQPDTGEVIDTEARRRYESRIRELQAEIDEAEANNDHVRAERAQAEFDTIVEHLTAALGLTGKTRKTGGTAERARTAVTHRIRKAVRRIADVHPSAGRHLERAITTGTYCRYEPEYPVDWTL